MIVGERLLQTMYWSCEGPSGCFNVNWLAISFNGHRLDSEGVRCVEMQVLEGHTWLLVLCVLSTCCQFSRRFKVRILDLVVLISKTKHVSELLLYPKQTNKQTNKQKKKIYKNRPSPRKKKRRHSKKICLHQNIRSSVFSFFSSFFNALVRCFSE